jgi:hypothetical protein
VAVLVAAVATAAPAGVVVGQSVQEPPSFRAGTELVTVDVQIAATQRATIRDLVPADFVVEVGGRKRDRVSATRLHFDEGGVVKDPARASGSGPACVFGFHRAKDLRTVHYLIGVDRTEADRTEVKQVRVVLLDKALAVMSVVWRSPIRGAGRPPNSALEPTAHLEKSVSALRLSASR